MLSIEEALTNLAEDYANKLDTKVIDRVEEMKADWNGNTFLDRNYKVCL